MKVVLRYFAFSSPSVFVTCLSFSKLYLFPINIIIKLFSEVDLNSEIHLSIVSKVFYLVISYMIKHPLAPLGTIPKKPRVLIP